MGTLSVFQNDEENEENSDYKNIYQEAQGILLLPSPLTSHTRSFPNIEVDNGGCPRSQQATLQTARMAAEARRAVVKSGDMADSMQQDAIDSALAVSLWYFNAIAAVCELNSCMKMPLNVSYTLTACV